MSGIVFKDFTNKKAKALYETMWLDNAFVRSCSSAVVKAPAGKEKVSNNSYCFVSRKDAAETLIGLFDIAEPDLFRRKLKMACNGSGQECRRITTLHSSSLCALLFFYNVTAGNPLELEIDDKKYHFTESVFEFKSPVIGGPSNMDVVLKGYEMASGKETVLFLESKFSEYVTSVSKASHGISGAYLENDYSGSFYKGVFWQKLHNTEVIPDTDRTISLSAGQRYYIDGIKQMISHYTGIRNLLAGKYYGGEEQAELEKAIQNGADIVLAEIIFDEKIGRLKMGSGQTYMESYAGMYVKFADEAMAEISKAGLTSRFHVAMKELGYSLFRSSSHKVEERILQFYF